jgi:outer membrane protein, heavy metal efflux system
MRTIFFTLVLFARLFQIHGQDTNHVSLSGLLTRVETNYPAVVQYQYYIQALEARLEGAKSWMPPTFSVGAERFPYRLSNLEMKDDPMNEAGIVFGLEQMLPNSGKLKANKNYIRSLLDVEQSKSNWTKNELKRDAKILYYTRYVTGKKQSVLKESEELLRFLLTSAEDKFANNQSQLQTIYKAKARLTEINNMQLMLEQMNAESNIGINTLLLRDINTAFEIDTLIKARDYSNAIADTSVISSRSDIIAMTKGIQSMQLEQKLMQSARLPDFGVRAEHMQMFGMPNQWSIMAMMTLPIAPWSSKMYRFDTKSIGFQIQAMEQERISMQLMAKRMLSEKQVMLNYETRQYENYQKEIVPAFDNNLQANLLAYRQNTGEFFVLLDAWEMMLMKQMEMYDKLLTVLKLEAEYEYESEIK